MEEIWKDIPNYEGFYQASNLGRIKSLTIKYKTERIMKPSITHGYLSLQLCKNNIHKTVYVHRLVAISFLENPNNYTCVNHKDEIRTNNCVENLEFCTHKYNTNYGTCKQRIGDTNGRPVKQKTLDGGLVKIHKSASEAGRELGIGHTHISSCVRGNRKTAGGFIWEAVGK